MTTSKFKHAYETFLPIPKPGRNDLACEADDAWLIAKGIDVSSPMVMHLLRNDVLPLVRELERYGLVWYSFLVHDYASGVPTTPDDPRAYIHLRLAYNRRRRDVVPKMPERWIMTGKTNLSRQIAGVKPELWKGGIDTMWDLIGEQAASMLRFIELFDSDDIFELMKQTRQFFHYAANFTQMTFR